MYLICLEEIQHPGERSTFVFEDPWIEREPGERANRMGRTYVSGVRGQYHPGEIVNDAELQG